ncbi:TPA: class I SAM-dependent DNA methyltransferase [Staphylococcus aureus]|uniref:site-specific DNA-methyltransferase (adenine-specific) n=2 Tax=Staphylococcus TaxID=1279 RepID=M1XGB6_STAAU|nr:MULTISPECIES: DNA methyltransferase [Staphylococcus]MCG2327193.1 N-6 DNA methylase [Staphylococcus epidermidis]MDI1629638.1 N-6 DNA methylase [Staphylococcus aureus]MDI1941812.1 N-6 DNA methylase [Staphylococcus aureus]RSZ24126.1 class I SAM-dependent DNA methyltransferase [Staphylococcus haemolyticus]TJX32084.1 class I SAM-dependent DNA methyltransferase [Staphylococcus haemolyticus]
MNKEIIDNALKFITLHKEDKDERQQAQMWIRDFLEIFNIPIQKINIGFEWRINIDGSQKYADHLLNGLLLIEMKSKKQKLDKAKSQAYKYVMNLDNEDIPKFVMLSNFNTIQLIDLTNNKTIEFNVKDLHKYIDNFNFLLNKIQDTHIPMNPVNAKAAKLMESLHDYILESKYPKNASDLLMTRIVFCFFAEDSGIFDTNQFTNYIKNETKKDGSDLVDKLTTLFQTLNTPINERFQSGSLNDFPYINGGLFAISQPSGLALNSKIRNIILETSLLDWSKISPVIFGSMFEGAMDKERRHSLGAHYTSEVNILKVINGLFLNELRNEFEHISQIKIKKIKYKKLEEFHNKLANLKFLDPACGSGNFLMVAYRELRRLEHEVIDEINQGQALLFDINDFIQVEINQFYGMEILPYAVSVAKIGLWMMDHLMNIEASELFGRLYLRLPLHASANIEVCDALTKEWSEIVPPNELDYVLGNPPFIGARIMSKEQKNTFKKVVKITGSSDLDYVCAWYYKTALLMQLNPSIKAALVSTNSVFQGKQANIIWKKLFEMGIYINFAHQSFKWDNNGATVHVCIAGFSMNEEKEKFLYLYKDIQTQPVLKKVKIINEYLIDAPYLMLKSSKKQISNYPIMRFGSMANDGKGNFQLDEDLKNKLIKKHPILEEYIHEFIGAKELLDGETRYILYLKDMPPNIIRKIPYIQNVGQKVYESRIKSSRNSTKKLAQYPFVLGEDRVIKNSKFLIIPRVSSENREYIPMDYFEYPTIASDAVFQLENASLFIMGVLQSKMHALWVKTIGGKLESRYRYSNTLVYNNFVFPTYSNKEKIYIENIVKEILEIRKYWKQKGNTLADLYDKKAMPINLKKKHNELDDKVEKLYKKSGFANDEERIAYLMNLYKTQISKKN